jgi:hypothetical protein
MNFCLNIQERVAALLREHTYFSGMDDATIITEKIADIEQAIDKALQQLGFGVVITTAKGDVANPAPFPRLMVLRETLTVALCHNPLLETDYDVLDALHAAIEALQGQPLDATAARAGQPTFAVTGHEARLDAPEGIAVHHLFLSISAPFR